ncbi:MAG TPA: hypothetical protein VIV09_02530, partial [Pseudolabrys sp.]
MQLTDVLTLVAHEGMRRRAEKRAGVMLPLAVGAMVPGIVHRAVERANSTEHEMNKAVNQPFKTAALPPWLAMPMAQFAQTPGKAMKGLGSAAAGAIGGAGKAVGGQAARAGSEMLGHGHGDDSGGGLKGSFQQLGAAPLSGVASGISGGIGESIKRMMLGREFGEKKDPFHLGAGAAVTSFG